MFFISIDIWIDLMSLLFVERLIPPTQPLLMTAKEVLLI